jgi:hypothetical protein
VGREVIGKGDRGTHGAQHPCLESRERLVTFAEPELLSKITLYVTRHERWRRDTRMSKVEPDNPGADTEQGGSQAESNPAAPDAVARWWEKYREKYYTQVDEMFFRTEGYAENAFRTNERINIVVVALGVVMILYAIAQSALRGADLSTVAFGGLGVADFFGLVFWTTQSKITETVGDLTQVQLIYRTYTHQVDAVLEWETESKGRMDVATVQAIGDELEKRTLFALNEIEKLIGNQNPSTRTAPSSRAGS